MNNDLISRDALKKALGKSTVTIIGYGKAVFLDKAYELIDNAPTVEPCYQTTSCLDCKNYDKETHNCPRYCEVIKEAIKSRPQGEYVDISKLRLMTVEECAGHTIEYAMGWKACVEWIKKGGAE